MAHPYFGQLQELLADIRFGDCEVVCKHFFGGAAVYANGKMVASLSPKGLAFKLSAARCTEMLAKGVAEPLCYSERSPAKRQYILFEDSDSLNEHELEAYFQECISTSINDAA